MAIEGAWKVGSDGSPLPILATVPAPGCPIHPLQVRISIRLTSGDGAEVLADTAGERARSCGRVAPDRPSFVEFLHQVTAVYLRGAGTSAAEGRYSLDIV